VVDKDGPVCTCGKKGCLEVYASGRGIARLAAEGVEEERSVILEELIHGNVKSLTAQDVALAASMNDDYSRRILETAGNHIGTSLSYMVSILNPERLIIGGSLTGAGKLFTDAILCALRRHTMKEILADIEVELSDLGVVASARGGALIAMEHLFT
jgi:predicted NBD/HSP70 family sugar kinase